MKSVIVFICLFVVAFGTFSNNKTRLSHPSGGRQKRVAIDGWGSDCDVAISGTKAFLAIVGVVASGVTAGAAAPIIGAGAGAITAGLDKVKCGTAEDKTLSILQDHLRHVTKKIEAVHDKVIENGIVLSEVNENTMFNGLASVYGRDILALKNSAKKFKRLDRSKQLIVKNQAQKRWMQDTLGHAPGTAFAAIENLMAMIKSGTGIFAGSSRSIYKADQDNQHVFCKPKVRDYLSGLIAQGAFLYFAALEMSGESIRRSDKRIYEDYLKDNEKLFKTHCESGVWCGKHYAKTCGSCGRRQNRCTGGKRPDGSDGQLGLGEDCTWHYAGAEDCEPKECTDSYDGGLIACGSFAGGRG